MADSMDAIEAITDAKIVVAGEISKTAKENPFDFKRLVALSAALSALNAHPKENFFSVPVIKGSCDVDSLAKAIAEKMSKAAEW